MSRLVGLENEYAVRIAQGADARHRLSAEAVWACLIGVLREQRPSFEASKGMKAPVFVENGGAFNFEGLIDGLIEGSTPECRGPLQVLTYQRAQERMLLDALTETEQLLSVDTRADVEIGLIRNARDVEGNLYGPQENYEVEAARGAVLWLWRALIVVGALVVVPLNALVLLIAFAIGLLGLAVVRVHAHFVPDSRWLARWDSWFADPRGLDRTWLWTLLAPLMWWSDCVVGALMHRRARRDLLPHLVSRIAVIGVGALLDDGRFALSERAPFVGAVTSRPGPEGSVRTLFELGHVLKAFFLLPFEPGRLPHMLARQQRLQLSSSEANRAQVAELLKVGTTTLVLDLSDRGLLDDAPQLEDPIAAMRAIACDPSLSARVPLKDGRSVTALELQRFYQQRAQQLVRSSAVTSLDAQQVVSLWGEVLDGLARDPRTMIGVLDWPTKQMLLDASPDLDDAARRKIAIRYHELGAGYYERFERRGVTAELVTREAVELATRHPPRHTPAFARGQAIRNAARAPLAHVTWDRVLHARRGRRRLRLVKDERP